MPLTPRRLRFVDEYLTRSSMLVAAALAAGSLAALASATRRG